MELLVAPHGGVRAVYSETIDLAALGQLWIRRASHVEPDGAGRWWVDLAPVAGPVLGPFARRGHALDAEIAWLLAFWLTAATASPGSPIEPGSPSPPHLPSD